MWRRHRRRVVAGAAVVLLLLSLVLLDTWRADGPPVAAEPLRAPTVRVPAAGEPVLGPAVPVPSAPAGPTLLPRLQGELPGRGAPMRIRVPELDVDSAVLPISGESGVLEPPADATQLGWWQEGAAPGSARGTSVMTGHTLHLGGGALDHLARLRPGDLVDVDTTAGTVTYQVQAAWVLSKPELAERAVDLFGQDRPGRLVLVTCFDWNGSVYLSNAVVSALPVETPAV